MSELLQESLSRQLEYLEALSSDPKNLLEPVRVCRHCFIPVTAHPNAYKTAVQQDHIATYWPIDQAIIALRAKLRHAGPSEL